MLKKILIGLAVLVALLFVGFMILQSTTKKASPEVSQSYTFGSTKIDVFYCQPSKKGREIFGALVPFGEVWRTGANEPTTITTDKDLKIDGKVLAAGKYSIWTIPAADKWTVIFNKEVPDWGVSWGGKAAHNEAQDALSVSVPIEVLPASAEKLLIQVEQTPAGISIAWDTTKVVVPIAE